ncbi:hypothetical protein [Pajaroellobacter abortibovis]|uniref:Uncharacterized protein n=1 Tax=Pajaroellobacter abortibovis TaxID=1882918 RepID=A0A1L6MYB6_9BACT|nr:hypothetical protein [Pajaroellobacter abortibovis]APS00502.1 hypothetical protein BCY86_07290 [Pajaroellobacter abortibovis]
MFRSNIHSLVFFLGLSIAGSSIGCHGITPSTSGEASDDIKRKTTFGSGEETKGTFRSQRFRLSFSLPDLSGWKVDDLSRPYLLAIHPKSHSQLRLQLTLNQDLMSRQRCEANAREAQWITPDAQWNPQDKEQRPIEDEIVSFPDGYETHLWVIIKAGPQDSDPVRGYLFAFGGSIRKCLFFSYTSVAYSEDGAEELSTMLANRLATARINLFDTLTLESLEDIPRLPPGSSSTR